MAADGSAGEHGDYVDLTVFTTTNGIRCAFGTTGITCYFIRIQEPVSIWGRRLVCAGDYIEEMTSY